MPGLPRGNGLFALVLLGCLGVTAELLAIFDGPPSRLTDPYLIGVLIVAYKQTQRRALLLLGVFLALTGYLLYPLDGADVIQMLSFTLLAVLGVWIAGALRRRASS